MKDEYYHALVWYVSQDYIYGLFCMDNICIDIVLFDHEQFGDTLVDVFLL